MIPGMITELAMKLKSGLFVSRSPLFFRGKKVPLSQRKIEIYKTERNLTPGMIRGDSARAEDPRLVYRVTGKKQNHVDHIHAPPSNSKADVISNANGMRAIKKEFIPRLDRRGITSRTEASAYSHAAVPTGKLEKMYSGIGYKRDRAAMLRMLAGAPNEDARQIVRENLRLAIPMVRRPRT